MYADDIKMFRRVDSDVDRAALQKILISCTYGHMKASYMLILEETVENKDLEIWIYNLLKPFIHVSHAVCKANQLLRIIRKIVHVLGLSTDDAVVCNHGKASS